MKRLHAAKTIQGWIRKFKSEFDTDIKQKYWKELMVPKQFELYIDELKIQEKRESERDKKLREEFFGKPEVKIEQTESYIRLLERTLQKESEKSVKYQETLKELEVQREKVKNLKTQLEKENK